MKRTTRDGEGGDDNNAQQDVDAANEDGGGPLNESEPCTLSEDFLDKCWEAFEGVEDANNAIRQAQNAKNTRLRQCQFLLQTLALDKVKSAMLHAHPNTAWFVKDISEIAVDPQNAQSVDITSGAKGAVVVRLSTEIGVERVILAHDQGMAYILNPFTGRWRGDILQRHRGFLEGVRNIRSVLLEAAKMYIAVRDENQKDPEKLWEHEYRDLIAIAKRSYMCRRENEKPTSKPKVHKKRREQTPAAGSRASLAVNRPSVVTIAAAATSPEPTAINDGDDDDDDDEENEEDAQI